MKLLARLLALLLTMVSAVLLTVTFLLVSPKGLEWAYRFATVLLPGELSIERLDGQLRGPLRLNGVHYHNDQIDIRVAQFDLQWRPGDLVEGKAHIEDLAVTGLHILQVPAASGAATTALPDIRLPLAVQIDHAALHDFQQTTGADTPGFILNDVELRNAAFNRGRLDLEHLAVSAPQFRFSVSGNLTPRRDYPLDLTVEWSANGGAYGPLAGSGRLRGDLHKIDVQHRLNEPVRVDLRGAVTDPLDKLGWQGEVSWPAMDLHALNAAWPVLSVSGKVHGSGDLRRVEAEGEVHSLFQNLHADHRFVVDYDHDRGIVKLRRLINTLSESGTTLVVNGTLSDLAHTPRAALAGSWQDLRWPLQGAAELHSRSGTFSVSGTLDDYRLQVAGDLAGKQMPDVSLSLDATGQAQALTVTRAAAQLLGGTLNAKGQIDWRAAPRWRMSIEGRDLDPGKYWPAWPGRLALGAQVDGDLTDNTPRAQVALTRLQGELKSIPLDAVAAVNVNGDRFRLDKLRVDSGGNRLTAAGTLRDEWNLEWQVEAADLAQLVPGSGGRLQGSGRVTGPRLRPIFTASLSGQEARFADNRIGALSLVMAVDAQGQLNSTVEIEARDADFGVRHFDTIRLRGDGTAQHHQAHLWLTAPEAKLELALSGAYLHQAWRGSLDQLELDAPAAGRWRLAAPAQISLDMPTARVHEFCLQQDQARLCAAANMNAADDWQLRTTVHELPLRLFEQWLPNGSSMSGKLDGQGRIDATPAAPLSGAVEITLQAGVVSPAPLGAHQPTTQIAYHGGHLNATLDALPAS